MNVMIDVHGWGFERSLYGLVKCLYHGVCIAS
jgi:hypothetical protein